MAKAKDKETKEIEKRGKELIEAFESELNHEHYSAAFTFLRENFEDIYAFYPEYAIEHDLALRIGLRDFDGAYEDLEDFKNRPYIRQSVEEILRGGAQYIRNAEKEYYESLSEKKGKKIGLVYNPEDPDEQVAANIQDKPQSDKSHIAYYLALLSDPKRDNHLRTGALIRLIEIGYTEKVTFVKNGQTYSVIPANMPAPGNNPSFQAVAKAMGKKRFSEFSQVPIRLLYLAELALYPSNLSSVSREETLIEAFYYLCKASFQQDFEFPSEETKDTFMRLFELVYSMPYSPKGNMGQA